MSNSNIVFLRINSYSNKNYWYLLNFSWSTLACCEDKKIMILLFDSWNFDSNIYWYGSQKLCDKIISRILCLQKYSFCEMPFQQRQYIFCADQFYYSTLFTLICFLTEQAKICLEICIFSKKHHILNFLELKPFATCGEWRMAEKGDRS